MSHILIYLDESGCLGFSDNSSPMFVITILKVDNLGTQRKISKAVERTIKNKISYRKKERNLELKGSRTSLEIKKYFYSQMPQKGWCIYTVILNKKRVEPHLRTNEGKPRLYNYLSKFILSHINLKDSVSRVDLYIDRSKNPNEIKDFDAYIQAHLDLSPKTILNISHQVSQENKAIQAVDLFCWGIARKYSIKETVWYECFKKNIECEKIFLP